MKNFSFAILAGLAVLVSAFIVTPARAQTFYNFTSLSGTNTAPILQHFAVQSNIAYMPIQGQTLIVTNINTNEMITLSYGAQVTGLANTNIFVLSTLTTNFPASAGWTNGATWIYPIPATGFTVGVSPWGTMAISNAQFTSGTCTNGVGLQ